MSATCCPCVDVAAKREPQKPATYSCVRYYGREGAVSALERCAHALQDVQLTAHAFDNREIAVVQDVPQA